MKSAIWKDTFREIRTTLNRFIAIFAIVALGVGFFAGLKATTPDMEHTADVFFDDQHFMDIRLLSTMGFTDDDVEALRQEPYIQDVMPAYTADVLVETPDGNQVVRILSIPEDTSEDNPNYLNRPVLTSGRLPKAPGECVIDPSSSTGAIGGTQDAGGDTGAVGSTLRFSDENNPDTLDLLKSDELTVVGTVQSPLYISFQRGTTDIGSGRVSYYVLVPDSEFDSDYYIELYSTVRGAAELDTFSDAYEDLIDETEDKLEPFAATREQIRYDEIVEEAEAEIRDAQAELDDGRREYETEKADAEQKLSDARRELDDAQKDIDDGQSKIAASEAELADGQREYESGLRTFRNEISSAQSTLDSSERELERARAQYEDGRAQLRDGERQYNAGLAQLEAAEAQYADGRAQLEAAQSEYDSGMAGISAAEGQLSQLEEQIAQMEQAGLPEEEIAPLRAQAEAVQQEIASGRAELEGAAAQIAASSAELEQAAAEIASNRATLEQTGAQLSASRAELEQAAAQIRSGEQQLEAGREELEAQRRSGQAQLDSSRAEIERGRSELNNARSELEQGRADLAEGRTTFEEEEADANRKLFDAGKELMSGQREIDDARAELADLEMPEWYILDRNMNVGYAGYASDSQKIANLSDIFPVFFFLVAALVCLTTMTRMVEEQRTQIGVLKALGYRKRAIASKYLMYAAIATIAGTVAGLLIGYVVFPTAIAHAYQIMYVLPPVICSFHWSYALIGGGAVLVCTVAAALFAAYSELTAVPAELIRPKAPPPGQRVFLERFKGLWSRMSFSQKVTARNLFRYKKRLLMTVLGIAGCTALMLTGFGLRDSIGRIVTHQFTEIHAYDMVLTFTDPYKDAQAEELEQELTGRVRDYTVVSSSTGSARAPGSKDVDVQIYVPDTPEALGEFITFRDRLTHEPVQFPDGDKVVITEKLSDILGAGPGDTISVTLDEGATSEATVSGVTENYVYNYVYMVPETFERMFSEEPTYRTALANAMGDEELSEEDETLAATELIEQDMIDSVQFTTRTRRDFEDVMKSLDSVVWLLIICANLLAFIVLYNLVNINITERIREIATIKVLGFFDTETSAYVFRENLILTAIGAAVGLVLGIALHQYVVAQAEVDIVMFERTILLPSYIYSFVLTMVFALIVDWVMHFKLKSISMVESLKSTE